MTYTEAKEAMMQAEKVIFNGCTYTINAIILRKNKRTSLELQDGNRFNSIVIAAIEKVKRKTNYKKSIGKNEKEKTFYE